MINILPTESESTKIQPKLEDGEQKSLSLKKLAELSDASLRAYIEAGSIPLRVATSPEIVIMSR